MDETSLYCSHAMTQGAWPYNQIKAAAHLHNVGENCAEIVAACQMIPFLGPQEYPAALCFLMYSVHVPHNGIIEI